jgi:hypothetical protein
LSASLRTWNLRLPLPEWPSALVESDYTFGSAKLYVDGRELLRAETRAQLREGVRTAFGEHDVRMSLCDAGEAAELIVEVDGERAIDESRLRPRACPSARRHALIALGASAAGFIASYLYLERAWTMDSVWALKMAYHMAGWHLLLTLLLAPASLLFGRPGIRSVQATSALFFAIHLGIAVANALDPSSLHHGGAIAFWNALSGLFFFAAVPYGNVAWRDMDPVRALRADD